MHFYRFPLKDYRSSTGHLFHRPNEEVTYRRLIDEYLYKEEPLQHDLPALSRRIGMDEAIVELVLKEFFEPAVDGEGAACWRLKWADEEIDRVKEITKRQKEKADKRWGRFRPSN
jgi:uncharacterized protein YdaU (DUF1376 family)